jgi:hypothetical protein
VATGAVGVLSLSRGALFKPYFGSMNPRLAIAMTVVLGFASLGFLRVRDEFQIYAGKTTLQGMILSAKLSTLFAVAVILVDLSVHFPRDLNVPSPWSLLFYPVIAYVAEIYFHALPLALLLIFLRLLFKKPDTNGLIWLCILLSSFLEPFFQLGWSEHISRGLQIYVGLSVFAFNFLQLYVFRRYDFVSMYSFRLVYYLYWHILWGYFRLQWLF